VSDVVVDASVWVSRLVTGDVHHIRSQTWFEDQGASGGLLVAPVIALSEVAGAISRRTGQPKLAHQAVELILKLPGLRLVSIDRALAGLAAELAADYGLRGADAVYVATARRLGVALVTLDKEQFHRAQAILSTLSP